MDLIIGKIYSNNNLYSIFKCGNSGGMRRSKETNSLVLIIDHTKSLYNDRWDDKEKILYYTGMGQKGNQKMKGTQNKTLNESNENKIHIFLFEVFVKTKYIYRGPVKLVKSPFQEEQLDINYNKRNVWIFPLKIESEEYLIPGEINNKLIEKIKKNLKTKTDNEIKNIIRYENKFPEKRKVIIEKFQRSQAIIEYALRRAKGYCQLCKEIAPFKKKNGDPYLEVHHIKSLSQSGEDTVENVVALCPNCHRKIHTVSSIKDIKILINKAKEIL